MSSNILQQQKEINRNIDDAYDRLEELEGEDARISEELKQLNTQRARFTVLSEVSDQLEKTGKIRRQ